MKTKYFDIYHRFIFIINSQCQRKRPNQQHVHHLHALSTYCCSLHLSLGICYTNIRN